MYYLESIWHQQTIFCIVSKISITITLESLGAQILSIQILGSGSEIDGGELLEPFDALESGENVSPMEEPRPESKQESMYELDDLFGNFQSSFGSFNGIFNCVKRTSSSN